MKRPYPTSMASKTLLVSILLLVSAHGLSAGSDATGADLNSALQMPGNAGTEFFLTFLPCYEATGSNKLMLYVASTTEGSVTVEIAATGFVQKKRLTANDITAVEIGVTNGQVFSKADNEGIPAEQVH